MLLSSELIYLKGEGTETIIFTAVCLCRQPHKFSGTAEGDGYARAAYGK